MSVPSRLKQSQHGTQLSNGTKAHLHVRHLFSFSFVIWLCLFRNI